MKDNARGDATLILRHVAETGVDATLFFLLRARMPAIMLDTAIMLALTGFGLSDTL